MKYNTKKNSSNNTNGGGESNGSGYTGATTKRKAPHFDFKSVNTSNVRHTTNVNNNNNSSNDEPGRIFDLPYAPVYYPTDSEFSDPFKYIQSIRSVGEKAGIVKIVPPKSWNPEFALDTKSFWFKTRMQSLNSMEGTSRVSLNYIDQLSKFHQQQGNPFSKIPRIDKKPVDLFKLKKAVELRGGPDSVTEAKLWSQVGRECGIDPGKTCTALGNSIKAIYFKWIQPYEDFLARNNVSKTHVKNDGHNDEKSNQESPSSSIPRKDSDLLVNPVLPKGYVPRPGEELCEICGRGDGDFDMLLCDSCDKGHHLYCLQPPLEKVPDSDWFCSKCLKTSGDDYGFQDGKTRSLASFQKVCNEFKKNWFKDIVADRPGGVIYEDDVEREFWRLIESPFSEVEVEYGADLHSSHHGSGFATVEQNPLDPYSKCPWNLNNMPVLPKSLFCNIRNDISGMMIPWLYVGMCFSTFCWHTEDHYTYSINYMHWGETKTWYGIPADNADRFEQVMKEKVPELFEANPDLLFHLTTMFNPQHLSSKGVKVVVADQRPGEFVITFPRAYHAGFNHGFNFNEAVNFALPDWLPYGFDCVSLYSEYKKLPVFSHDELVVSTFKKDLDSEGAVWIGDQLEDLLKRETLSEKAAKDLEIKSVVERVDLPDWQCEECLAYSFASCFKCVSCERIVCSKHVSSVCIKCENVSSFVQLVNIQLEDIQKMVEQCTQLALKPKQWHDMYKSLLNECERPPLYQLQQLLEQGLSTRIQGPEIDDLQGFVARAEEWVAAVNCILSEDVDMINIKETSSTCFSGAKTCQNLCKLVKTGNAMAFTSPEQESLNILYQKYTVFQSRAKCVISQIDAIESFATDESVAWAVHEINGILSERSKVPLEKIASKHELENKLKEVYWLNKAEGLMKDSRMRGFTSYEDLLTIIDEARGVVGLQNSLLVQLKNARKSGDMWNAKVATLLKQKSVSQWELEIALQEAKRVPVLEEYLNQLRDYEEMAAKWVSKVKSAYGIDIVSNSTSTKLSKTALAGRDVVGNGSKSRHSKMGLDVGPASLLPEYKILGDQVDVTVSIKTLKDFLDQSDEIPVRMVEAAILKDWIRQIQEWNAQCKRLFMKGSANISVAEILKDVLSNVTKCVNSCDRVVVDSEDGPFCVCRGPSQGFMVECDVCNEWYHGSCVRLSRKDVNSGDRYVCHICDVTKVVSRAGRRPTLIQFELVAKGKDCLTFKTEEREVARQVLKVIADWSIRIKDLNSALGTGSPLALKTISESERLVKNFLRVCEGLPLLMEEECTLLRDIILKKYPVPQEKPSSVGSSKKVPNHLAVSSIDAPLSPQSPSTELYCYCQRPNNDSIPMIGCDKCGEWYHFGCVGLSKAKASKIDSYVCGVCDGTRDPPRWHPLFRDEKRPVKKLKTCTDDLVGNLTTSDFRHTNAGNFTTNDFRHHSSGNNLTTNDFRHTSGNSNESSATMLKSTIPVEMKGKVIMAVPAGSGLTFKNANRLFISTTNINNGFYPPSNAVYNHQPLFALPPPPLPDITVPVAPQMMFSNPSSFSSIQSMNEVYNPGFLRINNNNNNNTTTTSNTEGRCSNSTGSSSSSNSSSSSSSSSSSTSLFFGPVI